MKIAIFADVHSNIKALEATYEDIVVRDVEKIYCAGDLVGYAPFPNEVIDYIKAKDIEAVMGNYDDGVGNQRFVCGCDYKDEKAQALGEKSIAWTKANTTEENKKFLRNLPHEIRFTEGNYRVLIVHGSPRALNEYLKEDFPEKELISILEESNTDILICGHTHKPYHKILKGKHVINVGSIGKPKHGDPNCVYALLEIREDVQVDFIKVKYDYEATATAIEESELPKEFAELIRRGVG